MRKGWRNLLPALAWLFLFGGSGPLVCADVATDRSVRLTVEIAWNGAAGSVNDAGEVELEVSEGQVIGVVPINTVETSVVKMGNIWRLRSERSGKVRAQIEAPVGTSLLLRAGGQAMRFPLPLILEGPQHAPAASPVEITVERVAWDVISVGLGQDKESSEGIAMPGARVPLTVGFNILTPEPANVNLRCTVELRPIRGGGNEPVWSTEIREVVATNSAVLPAFSLPVSAPATEGTYALEFTATWEPVPPHDRSKLKGFGRLIRRGARGLFGSATATRRVTLAVFDPKTEGQAPIAKASSSKGDQDVDTVDLTRPRGYRPTASGRSPLSALGMGWSVPEQALAESTRRDLLRGWISRGGSEGSQLAQADATGLAWSAVGLKVAHPGRPHRLTLTVPGGHPSALGVALVGVGLGNGSGPRLLLDACASGPPVTGEGPPASFSWLVWPGSADPVLVLANRSTTASVQVGTVTLTELAEVPAGPVIEEPQGVASRSLGLFLPGHDVLERFGATAEGGSTDVLGASRSLGAYLAFCGASAVVLAEGLADRERREALDGMAFEDAVGPDRLDLALRVLAARKVATWLEIGFAGTLPGLPDPGSPEALARGLVRVDRHGQADGPAYHPLNSEVRAAMRRRVVDAVSAHEGHGQGQIAGVLVRLGPGPTLLGSPDTGFDDATFARFVGDAFDPEAAKGVPGLSASDPARFDARSKFLAGSGRMPWLIWRSKRVAALYAELAEAARGAAPTASLAVVTPGPNEGAAGIEAHRADLAGLAPSLAWRAVGLDLDAWPSSEPAPVVLRGVAVGPDDLTHDLATHPELDAKVASRPARGLLLDNNPATASGSGSGSLTLSATAIESGPGGDEPLGHALAALDARWVWVGSATVAGHEERLRRFARVYRALPAAEPAARLPLAFGVAVRSYHASGQTFVVLANDTPYAVRLETVLGGPATAPIYDFTRAALLRPGSDAAGRHLVLDLLPFSASSVRVGAPEAKLVSAVPYPSDSVLSNLRARHDALSEQLSRLSRGPEKVAGTDKGAGPANPGFESDGAPPPLQIGADPVTPASNRPAAPSPEGWKIAGGSGAALVIDPAQPHAGRGALRLDVPLPPGATVCDDFSLNAHSQILVRAWLRADRPDARVRVWIEGESAGKPYRRVSELSVAAGWAERAVRASDVPPAGLDGVRLRFELLTAGSLWVDDLSVAAESLSEPERRNARNVLLAALQAFREERYADFARLAGSHWARQPALADGPATLTRSGDASALPSGRRLR